MAMWLWALGLAAVALLGFPPTADATFVNTNVGATYNNSLALPAGAVGAAPYVLANEKNYGMVYFVPPPPNAQLSYYYLQLLICEGDCSNFTDFNTSFVKINSASYTTFWQDGSASSIVTATSRSDNTLMIFYVNVHTELYILSCQDLACAAYTATNVGTGNGVLGFLSAATGANDLVYVLFQTGASLKLSMCATFDCTTFANTITVLNAQTPFAKVLASLQGIGRVVYTESGSLKTLYCSDLNCTSTTTGSVAMSGAAASLMNAYVDNAGIIQALVRDGISTSTSMKFVACDSGSGCTINTASLPAAAQADFVINEVDQLVYFYANAGSSGSVSCLDATCSTSVGADFNGTFNLNGATELNAVPLNLGRAALSVQSASGFALAYITLNTMCSSATPLANFTTTDNPCASVLAGDVCNVTCLPTYNNSDTWGLYQCNGDGSFTGNLQCMSNCINIDVPNAGVSNCTNFNTGTTCSVSCNPNYRSGNVTDASYYCNSTDWVITPAVPDCRRACAPLVPPNGGVLGPCGGTLDGDICNVTCTAPYDFQPIASYVCDLESGQWLSDAPCTRSCGQPVIAHSSNVCPDTIVGSICHKVCDTGYTYNTDENTTSGADYACQPDGTWSASLALICIGDCGNLTVPNANLVCTAGSSPGSVCTATCTTPFSSGNPLSMTYTCADSNAWVPATVGGLTCAAGCAPPTTFTLESTAGSNNVGQAYGSSVTVTCLDGARAFDATGPVLFSGQAGATSDGNGNITGFSVTCNSSGVYNPPWACRSTCPATTFVKRSACPAGKTGDTCNVGCDAAHQLVFPLNATYTCQGGAWVGSLNCIGDCAQPYVLNANYTPCVPNTWTGGQCQVTCLPGFQGIDPWSSNYVCQDDNNYNNTIVCEPGCPAINIPFIDPVAYTNTRPCVLNTTGPCTTARYPNVTYTVTCDSAHQDGDSSAVLACQANGSWNGTLACKNTCGAITTGLVPNMDEARTVCTDPSLKTGSVCTVYCLSTHMGGEPSANFVCDGVGTTFKGNLTCLPGCPRITHPNTTSACTGRGVGDTCTTTCNENYQGGLRRSEIYACQNDGTWNSTALECIFGCPPLSVTNATVESACNNNNRVNGTVCNVTCNPQNRGLDVSSSYSCLGSSDWLGNLRCRQGCAPPIMDNTTNTCSASLRSIGSTCQVDCIPSMSGGPYSANYTCQADGTYGSALASHVCVPGCAPLIVPNAQWVNCSNERSPGSTCAVSCAKPFRGLGESYTATCAANGTWLNVVACQPGCSTFTVANSANVTCPVPRSPGAVCTAFCRDGYRGNVDSAKFVCTVSGDYTGSLTCSAGCAELTSIPHTIVTYPNSRSVGALASANCKPGFGGGNVTSAIYTCTASGNWTGPDLRCVFNPNVCFSKDARLLMADGSEAKVRDLYRLTWARGEKKNNIGQVRDIHGRTHPIKTVLRSLNKDEMVTLPADAIAPGVPDSELQITASHLVHMPNGNVVRAGDLARDLKLKSALYIGHVYHVVLDDWVFLQAHNLGVESAAINDEHFRVRSEMFPEGDIADPSLPLRFAANNATVEADDNSSSSSDDSEQQLDN